MLNYVLNPEKGIVIPGAVTADCRLVKGAVNTMIPRRNSPKIALSGPTKNSRLLSTIPVEVYLGAMACKVVKHEKNCVLWRK